MSSKPAAHRSVAFVFMAIRVLQPGQFGGSPHPYDFAKGTMLPAPPAARGKTGSAQSTESTK